MKTLPRTLVVAAIALLAVPAFSFAGGRWDRSDRGDRYDRGSRYDNHSRNSFSVSVGFGGGYRSGGYSGGGYYSRGSYSNYDCGPRYTYRESYCPPPVVYSAPVYYTPAPTYYTPAPVYYTPVTTYYEPVYAPRCYDYGDSYDVRFSYTYRR